MKRIKAAVEKFKAKNNEVVHDGIVNLWELLWNELSKKGMFDERYDIFIECFNELLKEFVNDKRISAAKHLSIKGMMLTDDGSARLVAQLLEKSNAEIVEICYIFDTYRFRSLKLSAFKKIFLAISENCTDLRIRGIERPAIGMNLIEAMACLKGKKLQKIDMSINKQINSLVYWEQVFAALPDSVEELNLSDNNLPNIMSSSSSFESSEPKALGVASNVTKVILSYKDLMSCKEGGLKFFLDTYFPNIKKIGIVHKDNVRQPYSEVLISDPYFLRLVEYKKESHRINARDFNRGYGTFTSYTIRRSPVTKDTPSSSSLTK